MRKEELMAMTKEEIVWKLGNEQLEYLRKKLSKYNKNDLLFDDVEFHLLSELEIKEKDIAGLYQFDEDLEVHNIYILDTLIEDYRTDYFSKGHFKKYWKNRIKDVIRHEIVHAYVKERYGNFRDINKNINGDASQVFLAYLQFLNVESGHKCRYKYEYSEMYEMVKKCNTHEDLKELIISELLEVRDTVRKINDELLEMGRKIELGWGDRNGSVKKLKEYTDYYAVNKEGKLNKFDCSILELKIGSATDLSRIRELIFKQLGNDNPAIYRDINKKYAYMKNKEIIMKNVVIECNY